MIIVEEPKRGDMYQPGWGLPLSLFLAAMAAACVWVLIAEYRKDGNVGALLFYGVCGIAIFALGVCGVLSWANQKIQILDNTTFRYTTMFGQKRVYRFSDIRDIEPVRSRGERSLHMRDGSKVYIDDYVRMTDKLRRRINAELAKTGRKL